MTYGEIEEKAKTNKKIEELFNAYKKLQMVEYDIGDVKKIICFTKEERENLMEADRVIQDISYSLLCQIMKGVEEE